MRFSSSSKPISSPGRTEKFPPPLMRFLRSNVGSRSSRGRARKTPLFMRRKKALTSSSAIETTQEPSSPKVTCMGQVRVRRSKSKNNRTSSSHKITTPNHNNNNNNKSSSCCCWFKWSNICKPKFGKCVSFFNCRSVKVRTDSSKFGSNRFEQEEEQQRENVVTNAFDEERGRRTSISIDEETPSTTTATPTTPPKNALLLTRCRSAPYRSSSLACRFWESEAEAETELELEVELVEGTENRVSGIEQSRDSTSSESREDQNIITTERRRRSNSFFKKDVEICAIVQDSINNSNNNNNVSNDKLEECKNEDEIDSGKQLRLIRCKSEPAKRDSGKLDPLSAEFWRHRRSGNTESSTIHSHALH